MDLKEHFTEVIRVREQLQREHQDGAVYLVSIEKRQKRMVGGRIAVANPHVAALMIVQETHKLATQEQIAGYIEEQRKRGAHLVQLQARKDAKVNLNLGELVQNLVAANAAAAPPAAPEEVPAKQTASRAQHHRAQQSSDAAPPAAQ